MMLDRSKLPTCAWCKTSITGGSEKARPLLRFTASGEVRFLEPQYHSNADRNFEQVQVHRSCKKAALKAK